MQRTGNASDGGRLDWIPHADKSLLIEKTGEEQYCLSCTPEEYESIWRDYFDLNQDYRMIRSKIDAEEDAFLFQAAEHEKGIRILRQQPWEALVSFIISQNRNIPAIQKSIELLCAMAGTRKGDSTGDAFYDFYTFPTPEAVMELSDEALKECKLGYRGKYVRAAAESVLTGKLDLEQILLLESTESLQKLTGLFGVGEKVASCVLLYGLHQLDAFPIDVWVRRILENEYPKGYPFERYSPYNGVYQQYMFAYYRSKSFTHESKLND